MKATDVYRGSDGDLTKRFYAALAARGPLGLIAMNLFRAQKCSARAKAYSRKYKGLAYDRKDWSLGLLCDALRKHAADLDIAWGWGRDTKTPGFEWVLYVELPGVGQVSFHSRSRKSDCPDYPSEWDGMMASAGRIVSFCQCVYDSPLTARETG